jgi:ABC-type polysaccharide/polyol phosphate export permease
MKRFLAVLDARNKEFLRDRATLGWNLAFPILVLIGMTFIFSGNNQLGFKVALLGVEEPPAGSFFETEQVQWVPTADDEDVLDKLGRHQLDMVLDPRDPQRYWINSSSSQGYFLERLLLATDGDEAWTKGTVEGRELRYIDWMLPGLLAMNAMFSCLFGVGFVLVRYRKNGVLRRLKATPLTAFEFLAAQVVSRMLLVLATSVLIYVGADLLLDFEMRGSYLELILLFALGTFSLIALGLTVASRTASEELAGGLLNVATWPMMMLGGVWFSLEGSPGWVQSLANTLPLTHMSNGARAIMNDGASLAEITPHLAYLGITSLVFLVIGSFTFRWE